MFWQSGKYIRKLQISLQWRHNGHDGVSDHKPHHCLRKRLFRRRLKKTSKLHVTGLCEGIHRWPVNSPHKRPVTRKMFPFEDIILSYFWQVRHMGRIDTYGISRSTGRLVKKWPIICRQQFQFSSIKIVFWFIFPEICTQFSRQSVRMGWDNILALIYHIPPLLKCGMTAKVSRMVSVKSTSNKTQQRTKTNKRHE